MGKYILYDICTLRAYFSVSHISDFFLIVVFILLPEEKSVLPMCFIIFLEYAWLIAFVVLSEMYLLNTVLTLKLT